MTKLFKNRQDAGKQLAKQLMHYAKDLKVMVVALPRGGVIVGHEIAKELQVPLDIICPRKIGAPNNPEYALGAITESGEALIAKDLLQELHISEEALQKIIIAEREEAKRRVAYYRASLPPRELHNKKVLLVDDGLATGSTMIAAIQSVHKEGAKEVIVAVPVASIDSAARVSSLVDHFYCLATPSLFYAIGQFYEEFGQTSDEEVISALHPIHS